MKDYSNVSYSMLQEVLKLSAGKNIYEVLVILNNFRGGLNFVSLDNMKEVIEDLKSLLDNVVTDLSQYPMDYIFQSEDILKYSENVSLGHSL